jgi:hypothetical protein
MMFADSIVDWAALAQVAYISAIVGILIALTLGVGIVASLRAQDEQGGSALALNAVTALSVVLVAAAVVAGLIFMFDK